jgi:uncharacterized protein (TIGR02145 family)
LIEINIYLLYTEHPDLFTVNALTNMKQLTFLLLLAALLISCEKEEPTGSFTDSRDGHVYKTVTLGNQTWMAENLAYLPKVDPPQNGSVDEPFYYVYDYGGSNVLEAFQDSNYKNFGVLYNWAAAMTACPDGWYLPTDEDWTTLERYLGMKWSEGDSPDRRETGDVGQKLKSKEWWRYEKGNKNNSSGFNAPPGGERINDSSSNPGYFMGIFDTCNYWTSTPDPENNPWWRGISRDDDGVSWLRSIGQNDGVNRGSGPAKDYGYSVRCVKTI